MNTSIEEIQPELNLAYNLNAAAFAILFYDYFLTLGWEISRYWGSTVTWPTALFFANRYGTLLGNVPVVIQYFWSTPGSPAKDVICRGIESYHQFFFIITQVMTAVMLILRTYALYERNKRVLIFMMMVTAGAIVVGMWAVIAGKAGRTEENLQLYFGCNYGLTKSDATSQAASWAAVALFDCMIFTLTLYRVLSRRTTTTDLFSVLLRDGSIYFGVIVISNVSNILTFTLGTPYTRGIATTFTNILSSVLISRLMLNLRDPKLSYMSGRFEQSTTLTYGGPIRFADSTSPSGAQPLDTEFAMDIEMLNTTSNAGTSNQTPGMA